MNIQNQFADQGVEISRFEHDSGAELVADFGPVSSVSADVVGDTVIVVVDGEQYEITVEADAQAFITNGVLTIEVDE